MDFDEKIPVQNADLPPPILFEDKPLLDGSSIKSEPLKPAHFDDENKNEKEKPTRTNVYYVEISCGL